MACLLYWKFLYIFFFGHTHFASLFFAALKSFYLSIPQCYLSAFSFSDPLPFPGTSFCKTLFLPGYIVLRHSQESSFQCGTAVSSSTWSFIISFKEWSLTFPQLSSNILFLFLSLSKFLPCLIIHRSCAARHWRSSLSILAFQIMPDPRLFSCLLSCRWSTLGRWC